VDHEKKEMYIRISSKIESAIQPYDFAIDVIGKITLNDKTIEAKSNPNLKAEQRKIN